MEPQDSGSNSKRQSRHVSYNRAPLKRQSTMGPLEVDNPLADNVSPVPSKDAQIGEQTTLSPSSSILSPTSPSISVPALEEPMKDLSFLLRSELYHPLTEFEVPVAFRTSSGAPSPSDPLPNLLAHGHFRLAAIAAASLLTSSPPPTTPATIFSLFYTRLVCLMLINAITLAAQEVKALEDLSSSFYRSTVMNAHIVPWELRVLAVRLQGIGYGDTRRGIMGYYDLARDARAEIRKAKTREEREPWKVRLRDLGVRVANALVETGDLIAAVSHLETLRPENDEQEDDLIRGRLSLLYMKIGNVSAARRYIMSQDSKITGPSYTKTLIPLLNIAQGDFSAVKSQLETLEEEMGTLDPLVTQNFAVCLLYSGKVAEARPLLERLIKEGHSFRTLTFNLSTIYELCTDKSRGLKLELTEQVAGNEASCLGWEKANADFKL